MKLAPIALFALIALVATAGCGSTEMAATPASHSGTDVVPTRGVPCANAHQQLVGPKVLRRFQAVTAVSCVDGTRIYPGNGQWDVRTRQVAASRVARLKRYFEQPSERHLPKGGMCLDVRRFILVPTLVDAQGRWVVPRVPVNGCGDPLPLIPKIRWHVDSVRKVKRLVSAAALKTHCGMSVKDVPAGAIGPLEPSSGGSLFARTPKTATVCIFRTEDFEVGRFVRGVALDRAKTRLLVGALTGAAPTGDCANQSLFAVVAARNDPTAEGVWAELGGCFRVAGFRGGYTLGGGAKSSVIRSILGA